MSCWSVSQRGALHRGRRNIGSSCRKLYRDTIYVDARDRKIRKQTLQDIFVKTNPLCIPSSWTYETKDTNSSAFATPRCPQLQKGAPVVHLCQGHSTEQAEGMPKRTVDKMAGTGPQNPPRSKRQRECDCQEQPRQSKLQGQSSFARSKVHTAAVRGGDGFRSR
jgi:hypothetical protein